MGKRAVILTSMALGLIWSVVLLILAREVGGPPVWRDPFLVVSGTLVLPGLVLAAMIGRLAQRRFFDDAIIDGQPFAEGSGAAIDQKVLANTVEQLVLALCLWPFVWRILGDASVQALGLSFAATRVMFWIGYHLSPPLRGLGFAGSFYPTLFFTGFAIFAMFAR